MYHSVIPITNTHNPIVVEGNLPTQLLVFNAGPANVEVLVWREWNDKIAKQNSKNLEKSDLKLELRAGNQRIISGSFMRIKLHTDSLNEKENFAAVGVRIVNDILNLTF